jgi:hypothetical protein
MLRYGQFGIAFYKRPAITHGNFNPVLYVHRDNIMFQQMDGLLASIEAEVRSNPELAKRLQTFLLTVGGYVKRSDLIGKIEIDSRLDDSQDNNFYYEREWRSFHDWTFNDSVIAAIMIPQEFRNGFHELWKERFVNSSLISSQMVEAL